MTVSKINSKSVMIVEDDADLSLLLSAILSYQGIQSTTASGGNEALLKLQSGRLPDLIVTDMKMAGMNGDALVDKLHSDARTRDIPVVLSTAHPEILSAAQRSGFQGHLPKPYSVANVLALMKTFVSQSEIAPATI